MDSNNGTNRVYYLDFLRVFAIIAMICLHVSAQNWYITSVLSLEWNTYNFYDSIVRFCVPVFVMISGVLFLDPFKEITIKKLYSKYILRIGTAFCVWSVIYMIKRHEQCTGVNWLIKAFVDGFHHMWFLYMIIGLYMITPFLRMIMKDKKMTEYFLILSLFLTFIIPGIAEFCPPLRSAYKYLNFHFTLGYSCYFVAGAYLNQVEIAGKKEKAIYTLSIIGFLATIFISKEVAAHRGTPYGYYDYFSVFVMLESLGVFVFFKNHMGNKNFSQPQINTIVKMSNYSFGIYLVHAFIIDVLAGFGLNTLSFHPVAAVPVITLIVFVISYIISAMIHKIPVLNKYIV